MVSRGSLFLGKKLLDAIAALLELTARGIDIAAA